MQGMWRWAGRWAATGVVALALGAWLLAPGGSASAGGGGCFRPTVLYVASGSDVEFKNEDGLVHQLSGVGEEQPVADRVEPSQTATRTFTSPGIYPYYCALHWGMTGVIVVGDATLDIPASLAQSVPENPDEPAAPAGVAGEDGDDGLPGLAMAGLGALVGLLAATTVIWPVAWWRGRRRGAQ